jgi:hypothetical protein
MLTASLAVVLIAFRFDKSYVLLFLAPMVSAMAGAGVAKSAGARSRVALLACGAVAGNLQHSSHPFKRQVIVPFDEVIEFVHVNQLGTTAVRTSDVTVDFARRRAATPRDAV